MIQKQFEMLKHDVKKWNAWRDEFWREVDLKGCNLTGADLAGVDLTGADLTLANLSNADLSGADLVLANLVGTSLVHTNLAGANLTGANLTGANLSGADFSSALLTSTIFVGVNLGETRNLESIIHTGPSYLSTDTLIRSGPLPDIFLRGCGVPDDWIRYLPALLNNPLDFYSCFISYSHQDKAFARRLHDALQGRGIRCWLDEHHILPGDKISVAVDEGMRMYDKVLLCCTTAALTPGTGWWVESEMTRAFAKERRLQKERGKDVLALIPLNVDGALFRVESAWSDDLRARLAPDFTDWDKDNAKFERELERLIRSLRPGDAGRVPGP